MNAKIFLLLLATCHPDISMAATQTDLIKNAELAKDLNLQQYAILQTSAFGDLRSDAAYTSLFMEGSTSADAHYFVLISHNADGPTLFFSASDNCLQSTVNDKDVLNVNGQNVSSTSACIPGKNGGENRAGYIINTTPGTSYIAEQFTTKKYIMVTFKGKKIPFESGSFIEAWEAANSPAL